MQKKKYSFLEIIGILALTVIVSYILLTLIPSSYCFNFPLWTGRGLLEQGNPCGGLFVIVWLISFIFSYFLCKFILKKFFN